MRKAKSSGFKDSCDEETALRNAQRSSVPPCLDWIVDVSGRDKVLIFTVEVLDADSEHPTTGKIPCEVLERSEDAIGRELVRVSTENPCGIDSAEGLCFPGPSHRGFLRSGIGRTNPDVR